MSVHLLYQTLLDLKHNQKNTQLISLLSLIKDSNSDFGWVQKKFREFQLQPIVKCRIPHILIILRKAVKCSIWAIYSFKLWIAKRVFEPKTKRRKPLETLSFGNFVGFRKYKVQRTSPSLIRWIHCDSSILTHRTKTIIGTHWDGSMIKLRRVIVLFGRIRN